MRITFRWFVLGCLLLLTIFSLSLVVSSPSVVFSAQTADPPPREVEAAFAKAGCAGCHTIPGIANAVGQVGPDLSAIGSDAGGRVAGLEAADYIRQSIVEPAAFIAPKCPTGICPESVMPPNFVERLTAVELDVIVGYLLTMKGDGVSSPPPYALVPIEIVRPVEASNTPFSEPPKNYDDAQVLLGKYLFFDPRLSGDATVSCATCHQPDYAFSNGEAMSPGYTGTKYFRNAPTVLNTVFMDYLYWDGRMDGSDMPTLVRDHITEAHFMNSDGRLMVERVKQVPEYVQLFQEAFGSNPSFGRVLNAITAYVQSLNSSASAYDRYMAGESSALTDDAVAGLALFEEHCATCHNGPTFSDGAFHRSGLEGGQDIWAEPLRHVTFRRFFRQLGVPNYRALMTDPGLYALTKNQDDWGAFRTAPLREVARTAPYMHNGIFATLAEVVRHYNESQDMGLNDAELGQLVAFLESLSSELEEVTPTDQPDYQLRSLGDNR